MKPETPPEGIRRSSRTRVQTCGVWRDEKIEYRVDPTTRTRYVVGVKTSANIITDNYAEKCYNYFHKPKNVYKKNLSKFYIKK